MAPDPGTLFSPDQASRFLESSASIRTALEQFERASIGGQEALSVVEIVEVVIDIVVWFADCISQPHYDFPRANPDVQAGETVTDPKDLVHLGTVESKKRQRPRRMLLGSTKWQAWAWQLVQVLLGLKTSPSSEPDVEAKDVLSQGQITSAVTPVGSEQVSHPDTRGGRIVPTLAALLRRERRRRKNG